MRIGITGGIGSGKSFVCRKLSERGIRVYDCDSAAKRLMRSSEELKTALTDLIGGNTYIDGELNKPAVAAFLLASDANKRAIDSIVHPAVARDFIRSCEESGGTDHWMECAILFESGFDRLVDKVIAVVAPEDIRVERIMKRDGITADKAREWIAKQWRQEDVIARADIIIMNDGRQDLDNQIDSIINEITNKTH